MVHGTSAGPMTSRTAGRLAWGIAFVCFGMVAGGLGLGAVIFFFLLFPNGRPLTRRWRWVVRVGVVALVAVTAGNLLDPTTVQLSTRLPRLGNPIGLRAFTGFSNNFPSFLGFLAILILAVVSLVLRFRRARGEQRQQLKSFAYAVILSVCLLVVAVLLSLVNQTLSNVAWYGALIFGFGIAIPGAAVLAILKYGTYET